MRFLADRVGSVKKLSEIMGVNRAQMSRYLNGTAVPRAELLAEFAQSFGVTMDWFFAEGDIERDLSEVKFGLAVQSMAAHRNFELKEDYMPPGFYLFWKQLFSDNSKLEVLLAKVSNHDGVYSIKMSMTRVAAQHGELELLWAHDRYCKSVLFRSGRNLCMLSLDGYESILVAGSMEKLAFAGTRAMNKALFAGTFYCPQFNTPHRSILVKGVLEKITDNTAHVLEAGRKCGRIKFSELPPTINAVFDSIRTVEN